MKKFIFVLCVSMLFKPFLPVLEYVCNYDYIAKELCENKDNVQMGCNGKCYLMKELAKESETEKPLSSDKKHLLETTDLFFKQPYNFSFTTKNETVTASAPQYSDLYKHLSTDLVFHPPTFIA